MEKPAVPRLDDLQYKGLFLYQQAGLPCFTQDSVLLAGFARLSPGDTAVDLGAGTGALAVLCHGRTEAQFTCVEKNADVSALLQKSIVYNKLDIPVHTMDWADAPKALGHGRFSAVLCNPPYFPRGTGSPSPARAQARGAGEEEGQPLAGAMQAASALLKNGGKLFLCYPASQLADAICTLRENRLEPKRMRLVAENIAIAPYLALLEARKGGKPGMAQEPVLLLREADGSFTREYKQIYHMNPTDTVEESCQA